MAREQHRLQSDWRVPRAQAARVFDEGVARLVVPKLDLDSIVVEGTSTAALRRGPGHVQTSALFGDAGNTVVAAHRDTFFRNLDRLAKGDLIYAEDQHRAYRYMVTATRVVEPTDLSVLRPSPTARLTMLTCYPFHYLGPAPRRYVVTAELIGTSESLRAPFMPGPPSQPK